jgi:predicted dehydrogenase
MGHRGRDWVREVRASADFELVGCVDIDQQTRESVAASLSIPPAECFSDLDQALDQSGAQSVIIATSSGQHSMACESALSRCLGVLVEKPFTLDLNEAIKIVSYADAQQTPLLVAQNYRYMRSFRTVKKLIRDGALGEVGMIVCQYYRPPHDMAASLSRLQHSILWGVGVHHLDALRHILGKEVTNVTAESFTLPWGHLPEGASLRVLLSFEGDTRALYTATYESSGHEFFERGQEFYARFVGQDATLHVFQRWLVLCQKGKLPRLMRRGRRDETEEQVLLRQLKRAIVDGEPSEVSGRDNLKTMAILESCVRSATEGRSINPQELLH